MWTFGHDTIRMHAKIFSLIYSGKKNGLLEIRSRHESFVWWCCLHFSNQTIEQLKFGPGNERTWWRIHECNNLIKTKVASSSNGFPDKIIPQKLFLPQQRLCHVVWMLQTNTQHQASHKVKKKIKVLNLTTTTLCKQPNDLKRTH